jgi:hypothetical protein
MATFGYTTIGASSTLISYKDPETGTIYEIITGSVFTAPISGIAESITVALKRNAAGSDYVKCAIYNHADSTLVAQTSELKPSLTTSFAWYTFPFPSPKPLLKAGTEYVLVVWADYTTQPISIAYDAGAANQGHIDDTRAYGAFPSPETFTHNNNKYSIYCTFTPPSKFTFLKTPLSTIYIG